MSAPSILIVDDDPDIRESLSDMLVYEGYSVQTVAYGTQALQEVKQQRYGAALLDIQLPDLDGLSVLKVMMELDPHLPIVVMTGHASTENTIGSLTKGAFAYLTKPYNSDEVKAVLQRALSVKGLTVRAEHMEQALHASEVRFRALVESATDAIVLADQGGHIISWNKAAERLFGYEKEEALGHSLSMLMPARYREVHETGLARVVGTGQTRVVGKTVELVGLTKQGREFPLELSRAWWSTQEGSFFSGIIRDITERKRVESVQHMQLAVSHALAAADTIEDAAPALLQAMGEALEWDVGMLWRIDSQAQTLRCETIWAKSFAKIDEFVALSRVTALPPGIGLPGRVWSKDEAAWIHDVAEDPNFPRAPTAVRAGLHGAFAFPIRTGERIEGVIELLSRDKREPDPPFLQITADIGMKISQFMDRKQGDRALRQAYEETERILASLPGGILILNDKTEIIYANMLAEQYFARAGQTLLRQPLLEAIPMTGTSCALLKQDLTSINLPTRQRRQDPDFEADQRTYRYRLFPVTIRGNVPQTGMIIWDVTEEKHLQEQIMQTEKLASLGTMVSGMAHEINNPAQAILGMAELIREEEHVENIREYATDIITYAKHVSGIVRDFASYTRMSARDGDSDVDLQERLEEAVKMVRRGPHFGYVEVVTHYQPLPPLRVRKVEIDQLFVNLISNAVQAMNGKGRLTLSTVKENDRLTVRITDTGCGIPPSLLQRIFDPFFTTKGPGKGTGLGLSIAHTIVTKYGGALHVESEEGKGTTFTLCFPQDTYR
ncbi:MAG: PAS domain S-box protein [Nitrospiraceae bacterium]